MNKDKDPIYKPGHPVAVTTDSGEKVEVPLVWTPEWVGEIIDRGMVPLQHIGDLLEALLDTAHTVEHMRIGKAPGRHRPLARRRAIRTHHEACGRHVQRRIVAMRVMRARARTEDG